MTMILHSTRHTAPEVTFREALLRGLAPDGGLYLPTAIPRLSPSSMAGWHGLGIGEIAVRVLSHLVGDEFDREAFPALVREAFNFPAPTVPVGNRISVLELFHGPTMAFKDFGARFLARTFGYLLAERGDHATILVATSGDTGSAVAQGFFGVPGVQVVVLYPAGKVSRFQEAQMATLGGNVRAVRVPGTFDDCQRLVKEAFLDARLAALNLSSANSINIGRLLPQAVYYFASWVDAGGPDAGEVIFAVPSGNLGNLTAGIIAQHMGLPAVRFIAASNVNDVLPAYVASGAYAAKPAIATLSNAMDVGDPSNFPRLAQLHEEALDQLRANLTAVSISDVETRRVIRDVYGECGYTLDPHGAVGMAAARRARKESPEGPRIITLATAHPAKFGDVIQQELGVAPAIPEAWRDWESRPLHAHDLSDLEYETFKRLLSE